MNTQKIFRYKSMLRTLRSWQFGDELSIEHSGIQNISEPKLDQQR